METKECPRRGLVVKDNEGKWRKAVLIKCLCCGLEAAVRKFSNRETSYCSKSCSDLGRKKGVKVTCAFCNLEFSKKPSSLASSKSGLFFCTRNCKDLGQKLSSNLEDIWPNHYGADSDYRSKVDLSQCAVCSCRSEWKLTVHHIDGDRSNNVLDNLEVVCASCHCNRHSKLVSGRRVLDFKYLTPREEVRQLDMGH